ncbi:MAG TPA: ABC transporter permease [Vicinamibacterales bacterium]|nr:ABC transporter permease [Vicinamibacterales bacterium]
MLWRDVRDAVRAYRRTPGVALVVVVTLGLAIGANAAIFSLLNALALRDLAVRDPATLVQISMVTQVDGDSDLTFPMFRELSARQQVFTGVVGTWGNTVVTVNDAGTVSRGLLWAATGNVFEELGVQPAAGRLLAARDMTVDPPAAEPVAVLGYAYWQQHYGGDASVIGRTIQLDGAPFTVIGVAPSGFTGFAVATEPEIVIPLAATPLLNGRTAASLATSASRSVRMIGRLKTGGTIDQARAQLAALWPAAREAALPPGYTGPRRDDFLSIALNVTSASKGNERSLRARYVQPLVILLGIASLVLVIACTNVASLLLSRASVRRHEIGVRLALGATRWRVGRQLVAEGVLLSMAGAFFGVLLSFSACARIATLVFEEFTVPVAFDGRPDLRVIALSTAVAIVAGIACSVFPAWRGTRGTATEALRTNGRTLAVSGRAGRILVGAQLALSLVLLTTAGLLIRSLSELRAVRTGIERSDEVFVAYPGESHPGAYAGLDNDAYYPDVLRRLEAIPGVRRASASLLKPGTGGGFREAVVRLGDRGDRPDASGTLATRSPVAPGFLAAVGIPVVKGRDFDWRDNSRGPSVTVLSQSLARRLFGEDDPIGQRVRVGADPARAALEVIGVAADARLYDLKSADVFAAYTPALQDPDASYKCFVIRGDRVSLASVKEAVESLGRERVGRMVTLQYITDRSLLAERLTAMMSSVFGAIVMLLAGVGLFALMSYAVAQRRREIGIRMALGANRRRVVRDVVFDGLAVTIAGLTVGLAAALAAVRVVKSLLFGVTPQDPVVLAAAAATLVAIAILACLVPASRAARVDPLIALRGE